MNVNRPLYLALRGLLKLKLRVTFAPIKGFRVAGGDRLPRRPRPLILVCNHAAFVDSVYLILAVPCRFTICGARPRLFRNAALRFAMALANILKVESHEQFLRDTAALLAAGETLLIYPEMGRFPDGLGDFSTWAAEVALANDVPLLPLYLYGTTCGHTGAPRLVVGEQIRPAGDAESLTRRLRRAVVALRPLAVGAAAEA